jgi:formiminotetrahydrofolate cyclodeaminase
MPVQINEVIIKAVVDSSTSAGTGAAAATTSAGSSTSEAELAAMVLEIIKEKKER